MTLSIDTIFAGNEPKANTTFPLEGNQPRLTLIELLVVIAIIAILASLLLPALSRARDNRSVAPIWRMKWLRSTYTSRLKHCRLPEIVSEFVGSE